MAWKRHWQCCFESKNGTQYGILIYEQDYSGSVVQLTGAAAPFETQEDDADDIFTPIRKQTGYLRVLDFDGTLLSELMPENNTQRLVRLYQGTYANDTFTPHTLKWHGFLCAQAYTQPWDSQTSMIEMPVKSMLATLEDTQIDEDVAGLQKNVAYLLTTAFASLNITGTDLQYLTIISDVSDAVNSLLKPVIQWGVFFGEETINNEGDSYQQLVGMSYYEALTAILSVYGLQAREDVGSIYLAQYDSTAGNLKSQTLAWSYLDYVAAGTTVTVEEGSVSEADMLATLTFVGTDNVAGFLPGARSVKISLDTTGGITPSINLPQTSEDSTTPTEIAITNATTMPGGTVYVQPHDPRSGTLETHNFWSYAAHDLTEADNPVAGTLATCESTSVLTSTGRHNLFYDNPAHLETDVTTGAFPVRWATRNYGSTDNPVLRNGMMFNLRPTGGSSTSLIVPKTCYTIASIINGDFNEGYLHIGFDVHTFYFMAEDVCRFSDFYKYDDYDLQLVCILKFGDMYWNGSAWQSSISNFAIDFNQGGIVTNKTADIPVDETGGYFIPITSRLSGDISFALINTVKMHAGEYDAHSLIMDNLEVAYLQPESMVASQRSQNTYRRQILTSGFSADKELTLKIGTNNNNVGSPVFLWTEDEEYLQTLPYYTADSTAYERPELHLLDRLAAYYASVRRTLTGIVQSGVAIFARRFTYGSRYYFGIDAKHEWREDRQEIKFIEVTNP